MLAKYSFRITWWSKKLERFRFFLLKFLTRSGAGIFLKANDVIALRPMLSRSHEPALEGFIRECAANGYNDFFVDVGANIGLTSCFVGREFKSIVMYEPNPLSANIAEVNASIVLGPEAFILRRVALGNRNEKQSLRCPKGNWGGAHIAVGNQYSLDTLSRKDGHSPTDFKSHLLIDIDVVDTTEEFKKIFLDHPALNAASGGVIKIDAEGYEIKILEGLAAALPTAKSYVIVFESLEPLLSPNIITKKFPFHTSIAKLSRTDRWKESGRPWYRVFNRSTICQLSWNQEDLSGDLVLLLEPRGES